MSELAPFCLNPHEAETMVFAENFCVNRRILPGFLKPGGAAITAEQNADIVVALLKVGPFQIGQKYWIKEDFRITYDRNRSQTWVQYAADNQIAGHGPVHGETKFAQNGVYAAQLMERWMSRGEVSVVNVGVVHGAYHVRPSQKLRPKTGWCWSITLHKKVA